MKINIGKIDRILRIILGLGLLAFAFFSGHAYAWLGFLGLIPLATAAMGSCPLYTLVGLSTCPAKRT
jgi:Protein of unknown function (DUF2892)